MNLERFEEWLRQAHPIAPLIVKINYKYDFESQYTESNEILFWDFHTGDYVWDNDWNEGQQDIIIVGYVEIEDVEMKHIF